MSDASIWNSAINRIAFSMSPQCTYKHSIE